MSEAKTFEDLIVWQKSMDLVESVYVLSSGFPADERFGLTQQIRRSAVSIPSNIAEGQGRESNADFIRLLVIARGSANELLTQLKIALRLQMVQDSNLEEIVNNLYEVKRMLSGLISSIKTRN